MTLTIYNSLSRKKEVFTPVEPGKAKMYVCGMTVYSDAHIGHARTYLAFDVIRRYLEYKGYHVKYIQNITDVDDKIITAAQREKIDALEYSRRFADRCLSDLDMVGIHRADAYPKASETISQMIAMIKQIIDNGYGYVADGDVYFSVEHFKSYGKLSGQNIEEMKTGARIEPGEHKKNPLDFALWKHAKPGEPSWDSPWGEGRPGWHIECSAMSSTLLGLPFDIHGGGMDLRFPHHENEIAQSEAATGKTFANYWMHVGLLTVNGEKMSKSLGNIVNIRDLLKRWDPEVIRFFFVQTQYRSPPDFSEKALQNAAKALEKLHRLQEKLDTIAHRPFAGKITEKTLTPEERDYLQAIKEWKKGFEEAMDDDFNTPQAVAALFDFVTESNRYFDTITKPNEQLCTYAKETLLRLGRVLTLFQEEKQTTDQPQDAVVIEKLKTLASHYHATPKEKRIDELIKTLLDAREQARKNKNWKTADEIRKDLHTIGFEIQDTEKGPVWRKNKI